MPYTTTNLKDKNNGQQEKLNSIRGGDPKVTGCRYLSNSQK